MKKSKKERLEKVYMIRVFNPHRFEMFVCNGVVYKDLELVKKLVKKSNDEGMPATWETFQVW